MQTVTHQDNEEEEVDDEGGNDEGKISHTEWRAALQLATTNIEQQTQAPAVDMFVKKWHNFEFKKTTEQKKNRK